MILDENNNTMPLELLQKMAQWVRKISDSTPVKRIRKEKLHDLDKTR